MKKDLLILVLFIAISIVFTWPLVGHMSDSVPHDAQDPLTFSWIMAWDIHKLSTGISGYWDANIFYPNRSTLAYGDHITGVALMGLPVMLLTSNIIFTYNLMFLASFILSGFGTYLLVRYLVKDRATALVSGIIFAFAPFRFCQISHIHMLTMQWIPFFFLFMHKFFDKPGYRNLLLFSFFYVLQFLSSGYYAVHITMFGGAMVVFSLYRNRYKLNSPVVKKLLLAMMAVALITGPFAYIYISVKKGFDYSFNLDKITYYSAVFRSYLSSPYFNRLYGGFTGGWGTPEGNLFPGLAAVVLLIAGMRAFYHNRFGSMKDTVRKANILYLALNVVIAMLMALCINDLVFGDGVFKRSRISHFLILASIRIIVDKSLRNRIKVFLESLLEVQGFYVFTLAAAFLFSLGPYISIFGKMIYQGPYNLLMILVPGFSGMRVPSRFAVMFMLALAVLAGYGFRTMKERISRRGIRYVFTGMVCCIMLLEYLSAPLLVEKVKTGNAVPEVYRWLSKQEGDFPIVEFPTSINSRDWTKDIEYLYYSTYHWKQLVNGVATFSPPSHDYVKRLMRGFPSEISVKLLKEIGVRYVIVHTDEWISEVRDKFRKNINRFKDDIMLVKKIEEDLVYGFKTRVSQDEKNNPWKRRNQDWYKPYSILSEEQEAKLLSRDNWSVESNYNNKSCYYAIDGDVKTRWDTGASQKKGMYYKVDMKELHGFSRILLSLDIHQADYPRAVAVEVSDNGRSWRKADVLAERLSLASFEILLKPVRSRFVRIVQTGSDRNYYWSINEINIVSSM